MSIHVGPKEDQGLPDFENRGSWEGQPAETEPELRSKRDLPEAKRRSTTIFAKNEPSRTTWDSPSGEKDLILVN
jgi:hypothetical protein